MCWDSLSPCLWLWPYCITWPLVNGEIINNLSWAIMQRQGLWLWNINGNRKRLCVYALWPVNDALIGWPINSQVGNDGHVQGYNPGPPQSLFLFLLFSYSVSITLSVYPLLSPSLLLSLTAVNSHPAILHLLVSCAPSCLLCMACLPSPHAQHPPRPLGHLFRLNLSVQM